MRRLSALFLVLFLTAALSSTVGAAPAPNCYAGYPHGIQGTYSSVGWVVANPGSEGYHMEEDYQIWADRNSQQLRQMLSNLAGSGPLQFTWVTGQPSGPMALYIVLELHARGKDSDGYAQAYWSEVMVQGAGVKKGYLFHYTTQAYEPQGDWSTQMLQEAANGIYSYLANGWTCGK